MVLLTGATGFLGSFVLDELLSQNYEVTAIIRSKNRIMDKYPNVEWVTADLGKATALDRIPVQRHGIVHLASTLSLHPEIVMGVDIPAMWGLLEKWEERPFVFVSSTDVYGDLKVVPADEEHPLEPSHWYGFGKLVCEQQLQMAARMKNRSDFVIFRPPYILGPHEKFHSSLIGRLIRRAISGCNFILPETHNRGEAIAGHSWVSACDLARWIVKALDDGPSGIYNAASGFFTWEKLLELILTLTGSSGKIIFQRDGDKTLNLCNEERRFSQRRLKQAYHMRDTKPLKQTLIEVIAKICSN